MEETGNTMSDDSDRYSWFRLSEEVRRRDFLRLGLTTAGMLAIAACGGGGGAGTSGQTTGPDFKVGMVVPQSKTYAALGESLHNGFMLYLAKVGGTAGGRKITVLLGDEEDNLPAAQKATQTLVEQNSVDMICGYVASPIADALCTNYLAPQKIPTIVMNAGVNALSRAHRSPYVYRTSFTNWQPTHPMGDYLNGQGVKKVTLAYAKYGAGIETAQSFKETYKGQIMAEVATDWPSTVDFSAAISRIASSGAEAIYSFYSGQDAINFFKQAKQVGLFDKIKFFGSGFAVEQDVLQAIPNEVPVGAITALHWAYGLDTKENADFKSAYQNKYGKQADVFAVQGYDTARVVVDALNAVKGKVDKGSPDAFLTAISKVAFRSPRGDFRFDPASNNPSQTIYIRQLVRDPKEGLINKPISSVPNVADPGK